MSARAHWPFRPSAIASRTSLAGLAIALTFGATACAGDFGRPKYPWAEGIREAVAGPPEYTAGIPAAPIPFTDEEKQLRKLAQRLVVPANEQELGFGYGPASDFTSYAAFLL